MHWETRTFLQLSLLHIRLLWCGTEPVVISKVCLLYTQEGEFPTRAKEGLCAEGHLTAHKQIGMFQKF